MGDFKTPARYIAPRTIGQVVGTGEGIGGRRNVADEAAWVTLHGGEHGGFGIGYAGMYAGEIGVSAKIRADRAARFDPVHGKGQSETEAAEQNTRFEQAA